ncbi:MAG: UDP-N-acetylglucosamine--LPS N-acetylglucosamine transferase [Candidatus Methylacidiphilales bacterium]|nr:UDP-N-acetylglucosamine--LPS N-acetylglucosamine transferase [Candidatus Methylacidiphilales bacterium]
MKKILIFTAGFGEGHNTAARNIRAAIEYLDDEAQVEIIDLFESCYGRFNDFLRSAYQTAITRTPTIWRGFYRLIDNTQMVDGNMLALKRMRKSLANLLLKVQPDAVISTYPIYNYLIEEIYKDGREKNFAQLTVVTDSISINSLWFRAPCDTFIVPNEESAGVLRNAGVEAHRIQVLGFPVQLEFAIPPEPVPPLADLLNGGRPRVLYLVNADKKKAPKVVQELLGFPDWHLTIGTGRDVRLQAALEDLTRHCRHRTEVLGWTSRMPYLLMTHHLVISKAGGATTQEAIAGRCPMVISQVVPGQEEGNYELIRRGNAGAFAERSRDIVPWVERAFDRSGRLWSLWRKNIAALGSPESALRIARFTLDQAAIVNVPVVPVEIFSSMQYRQGLAYGDIETEADLIARKDRLEAEIYAADEIALNGDSEEIESESCEGNLDIAPAAASGNTEKALTASLASTSSSVSSAETPRSGLFTESGQSVLSRKGLLLCDFHTHTTFSDGKLTVPEIVDFYGQRGFDCLCITDHLCDPSRLIGRMVTLTGLVIPPAEVGRYFAAIEAEKRRAWKHYGMILMTGLEFNKDGLTKHSSTHLLGVDLRKPIDPSLDLKALIHAIQSQGGLAIASHPHETGSTWGRDTLYLWEHQDEFAPILDAWEIANRDDIFNPVGLKRLPFLGNSDFHKPKHIHSWKTLLYCEKDPEAIKECIRVNRNVSLTLYRDHRFGTFQDHEADLQQEGSMESSSPAPTTVAVHATVLSEGQQAPVPQQTLREEPAFKS